MESRKIFEELGQGFWHERQPDGYSSDKNDWLSGEMFERRIRFSDAIYSAGRPKFKSDDIMNRIDANKEFNNDFKDIKFESMEKSNAKGNEVLSFTIEARLK